MEEQQVPDGYRYHARPHHNCDQTNFAKMSFNSLPGLPPARPSKDPFVMPSMSETMLAQATRAIAPPMLTRRTPRSVSSPRLRPGRIMTTLTGLGVTARTIDSISPFSRTPGAYRQSAPASANATSLSIAAALVGGSTNRV